MVRVVSQAWELGYSRRTVRRNNGCTRRQCGCADDCPASRARTRRSRGAGAQPCTGARRTPGLGDGAGARYGAAPRRGPARCAGQRGYRLHTHVNEEPTSHQAKRDRCRSPRGSRRSGSAQHHVRELDPHAGGDRAPVSRLSGRRQGQRSDRDGRPGPGQRQARLPHRRRHGRGRRAHRHRGHRRRYERGREDAHGHRHHAARR